MRISSKFSKNPPKMYYPSRTPSTAIPEEGSNGRNSRILWLWGCVDTSPITPDQIHKLATSKSAANLRDIAFADELQVYSLVVQTDASIASKLAATLQRVSFFVLSHKHGSKADNPADQKAWVQG